MTRVDKTTPEARDYICFWTMSPVSQPNVPSDIDPISEFWCSPKMARKLLDNIQTTSGFAYLVLALPIELSTKTKTQLPWNGLFINLPRVTIVFVSLLG